MAAWTFLTNHTRVLSCLAREPGIRLRDIAQCAEITERTTHRIVDELVEAGYVTRHRLGTRSFYEVHPELPLRHPLDARHKVGEILAVLLDRNGGGGRSPEDGGQEGEGPVRGS